MTRKSASASCSAEPTGRRGDPGRRCTAYLRGLRGTPAGGARTAYPWARRPEGRRAHESRVVGYVRKSVENKRTERATTESSARPPNTFCHHVFFNAPINRARLAMRMINAARIGATKTVRA